MIRTSRGRVLLLAVLLALVAPASLTAEPDLEDRVRKMAAGGESATLIRSRHKQITTSCVENLLRASALSADRLELMAEALRAAAYDMGRLTGRIDVEEILDAIFREFCIGK